LVAVALSGVGFLVGVQFDLRAGWVLVVLGQGLLVAECFRMLGMWRPRHRG